MVEGRQGARELGWELDRVQVRVRMRVRMRAMLVLVGRRGEEAQAQAGRRLVGIGGSGVLVQEAVREEEGEG